MLAYDVFSSNAFQATEIEEAVGNIVYIPQMLGTMGIFEQVPIRTTTVGIYKKNETLALVPTTERGTPETLPERDARSLVQLPTLRLAQRDRINGNEVQNIVNEFMPFDTALGNAQDEVDARQRKLVRKLELTREYHRFAAIQGFVLDADGSTIINSYTQFGISQPAAISFNFTTLDLGALRTYIEQNVARPMIRQLAARATADTKIYALCGDGFYDKLMAAPEVRAQYLNWSAAADLSGSTIWGTFQYAGVTWINYRGTNDNSTIAVSSQSCIFFPVNAEDVFKEYWAPGENMEDVNTLGKEFYSAVSPDNRINIMQWVDVYLWAYPLFICIAPDVLMRGTAV